MGGGVGRSSQHAWRAGQLQEGRHVSVRWMASISKARWRQGSGDDGQQGECPAGAHQAEQAQAVGGGQGLQEGARLLVRQAQRLSCREETRREPARKQPLTVRHWHDVDSNQGSLVGQDSQAASPAPRSPSPLFFQNSCFSCLSISMRRLERCILRASRSSEESSRG